MFRVSLILSVLKLSPLLREQHGTPRRIWLDNQLSEQFDVFIHARGYTNRSEAMRDLIREQLESARLEKGGEEMRRHAQLYLQSSRERSWQPASLRYSMIITTLSYPACMCIWITIIVLRLPSCAARFKVLKILPILSWLRGGVRHGKLHMVPVEIRQEQHSPASVPHTYSNPLT